MYEQDFTYCCYSLSFRYSVCFFQKNEQKKSNSISSLSLDVDDYGNSYVAGFFELSVNNPNLLAGKLS